MSESLTPTGLEPLIKPELYWELYDMRTLLKHLSENNQVNAVFTRADGRALSHDARVLLQEAPHLVFKLVAHLQEPSFATSDALIGALAACLGIRGHKRPDYTPTDPRVGL